MLKRTSFLQILSNPSLAGLKMCLLLCFSMFLSVVSLFKVPKVVFFSLQLVGGCFAWGDLLIVSGLS